jgi:hypothetical protein
MVGKKKNEATSVASPRSSSRSRDDKKLGKDIQEEFIRQLQTMFGGIGKLNVEPKIAIPTDQKPDKKKLN